jgi:hypothetical protein
MVTFLGTPHMLVTLNPPIGNIKRLRFDENGEITTENERVIKRFHHKFDSKPANGGKEQAVEEVNDGSLDITNEVKEESHACKKCNFTTDNKGLLMAHYRSEHPKEG